MPRRAGAVLLALALLCCSKMPGVMAPPAKWDHGPLPPGLHYLEVPADQVGATCRDLGDALPENQILACYSFVWRVIVLPTRASDPLLHKALRRHEEGHARGWPANHPLS